MCVYFFVSITNSEVVNNNVIRLLPFVHTRNEFVYQYNWKILKGFVKYCHLHMKLKEWKFVIVISVYLLQSRKSFISHRIKLFSAPLVCKVVYVTRAELIKGKLQEFFVLVWMSSDMSTNIERVERTASPLLRK